jgi:hypothetical protein
MVELARYYVSLGGGGEGMGVQYHPGGGGGKALGFEAGWGKESRPNAGRDGTVVALPLSCFPALVLVTRVE